MKWVEKMFEKDFRISYLLDFYGNILTDKQKDAIDLYYNEDLSLAEIADHQDISRQGVRDAIKRGEETLIEMENKLGFAKLIDEYRESLEKILNCTNIVKISRGNMNYYKIIEENINSIAVAAKNLLTTSDGVE